MSISREQFPPIQIQTLRVTQKVRATVMSLSKPRLIVGQKDVFAASAAVQTYLAAILAQPDIELDQLPDLPDFQKTARQHAQNWLDQVLPAIITTNADIIDYANVFAAFYKTLMKLAEKIDAGNKKQIKEFTQGLGLLRNNLSRKNAQAKYTEIQLQQFKAEVSDDYENFNKVAAEATKKLEGADGELAKISAEIETIDGQLHTYIGVLAGGGVGMVGGIVMILVGSFAEIETAGISTGLIVAGAGLLVGGIGSEITGGVEYALALQERKTLQEKLAADKQGIGILKHVLSLVNGFVSQTDSVIRAVGVLQDEWSLLLYDLDQVIADLDRDPGTLGLVAMLKKAKGDWENALDLALRMQPRGNVPVKAVDSMMDVIHTGPKPQRAP